MERYYGFDLGDAESAVARLEREGDETPALLQVNGATSFVTAYALQKDGSLLIGESACYEQEPLRRGLRFKSAFLTDRKAREDLKCFAGGVLGELYLKGDLIRGDDQCFYIGCPAGWDKTAREDYRELFVQAGYPPLRIISESRAALISACRSRHLQVGYDIMSRPVLVVDIGSSTTDFAYICSGREVELKTGGEVRLGGGIMDELLLEHCVKASKDADKIRQIFEKNDAWRTYSEFAARRLKEKYYADEEYWRENPCQQLVTLRAERVPVRLKLWMDDAMAQRLVNTAVPALGNRSFQTVFLESLQQARKGMQERLPELIFLTGGVSRLPQIREWCREAFPEAVVVCGQEPEFAVARGLACCGRIDEQMRAFRTDVENLIESTVVEEIVEKRMDELYRQTVEAIVDPILEQVAIPVMDRWRNGSIERLGDIDAIMEQEIEAWLHSPEGKAILQGAVSRWLRGVAGALEEYTMPICARYNIPYAALNLNTYLSLTDMDIRVEAKDLFAVEEITWLIDAIVSILIGLLCGGSGVALITTGIEGILIGAVVSILVLALGKEPMQEALLRMKVAKPIRRLLPKSFMRSRMGRISDEVKETLRGKLDSGKREEITKELVRDISQQIETCLIKMAEVVEIPLV